MWLYQIEKEPTVVKITTVGQRQKEKFRKNKKIKPKQKLDKKTMGGNQKLTLRNCIKPIV
ncbi:MAG: hypothetical protein WCI63_00330 [bacterium]